MFDNKKILAIIPARGGSKGIPRKNIKLLAGKPLLAWTVEEAKKSEYIDRLILSSEDYEIMTVAKKLGCEVPFNRPAELARDDTPGIAPVLHALGELPGFDYVVLLQPTSPLRTVQDIDNCIKFSISNQYPVTISVTEASKSPYQMYKRGEQDYMTPVLNSSIKYTRRQELPKVYEANGAVYVAKIDYLLQKKDFLTPDLTGFLMPRERSLDVDTLLDFEIAEYHILRKQVLF